VSITVSLLCAVLTVCRTAAASVVGLAFVEAFNAEGQGLGAAEGAVLSPDGMYLYVVGGSDALGVFARDGTTGRLTFVEVHIDGVAGVDGIDRGSEAVISPDGAHLYVSGRDDDAVAVFSRNVTTGTLTFVEAQKDGIGGVDGLAGASSVTISPDGAHVYATGRDDNGGAVFSRNATTGALTFVEVQTDGVGGVDGLGLPNSVAVAPDGGHVYVASSADNAVAVFSRNGTTGALTFVEMQQDGVGGVDGLADAVSVAVSPDDAHVYVVGNDDVAIAAFTRNTVTGALSFITSYGSAAATAVALSADGTLLFGARLTAVDLFGRNTVSGTLTPLDQQVNTLRGVENLNTALSIAVSSDAEHVYLTAQVSHAVVLFEGIAVRCDTSPLVGCRQPTESGKAVLRLLRIAGDDTKDRLRWKWPTGAATTLGDFGDPLTTTDYALCIYDASAATQPVLRPVAPAARSCAGDPCWKTPLAPGFRFKDNRHTLGLRRLSLTPGAAGLALIKAQGAGTSLTMPTLPLTPPVTVQLVNSLGECWEATYSTPIVNDAVEFRAKGD
jgi:6-phosphogluconolactonase (cycloisomerase 2 family)